MTKRVNLLELMGHPMAQSAVQQIAQGIDPRLVAAQLAGNALTGHIARSLGAVVPETTGSRARRDMGTEADGDVIDAEYTVINVSPGVKKRQKAAAAR